MVDLPQLTDPQLAIMRVIWRLGKASVSEVVAGLPGPRKPARNTVQTTMQRLADKGWLRHQDLNGTFIYEATRAQSQTQADMANRLVDAAFDGSVDALVMTLVRERGLDADAVARLRSLIDEELQP